MLPSDSRFRKDLLFLIIGDKEKAHVSILAIIHFLIILGGKKTFRRIIEKRQEAEN